MEINVIDKNTFPQFQKLVREYLPDTEEEQLLFHFEEFPWSYLGLLLQQKLIVFVCGWEIKVGKETGQFVLQGIAIDWEHKANGLGGVLLNRWEKEVFQRGYASVSVGSADGYVEKFYIRQGYVPKQYKAFDNQGRAHVKEIESPEQYHTVDRDAVILAADGNKGFIVFEKSL